MYSTFYKSIYQISRFRRATYNDQFINLWNVFLEGEVNPEGCNR